MTKKTMLPPPEDDFDPVERGLVPVEQPQAPALFDTSSPQHVIEKAQAVARLLVPIIESQELFKLIPTKQGPKKFVYVDGWTTMLAMLGVFPHVIWSRRIPHENACVYESRVELRTLDGRIAATGEALCSSLEENWETGDEYAIRSMSQTRAVGKAARLGFSWILKLAGYEGTPAEEMEGVEARQQKQQPKPAPPPTPSAVKEGLPKAGGKAPKPWIPPAEWFDYLDKLFPLARERGLALDPGKTVEWLTLPEHRNEKDWWRVTKKLMDAIPADQIPDAPQCVATFGIQHLEEE